MREFSPVRAAIFGVVLLHASGFTEVRGQASLEGAARAVSLDTGKSVSDEPTQGAAREALKGAVHVGEAAARSGEAKKAEGAAKQTTVTTITAKNRLLLDSKNYEATFYGEVSVVDSRFTLTCEKLTAYLKRPAADSKGASGGQGGGSTGAKLKGEPEGGAVKPSGDAAPKEGGGGVDKAVAEGDVVIVQDKMNDKGELERSIGRAQKAIYDAVTGNITLSGWPQVEQKQNTVVGTEERAVIVLNAKGSLEVLGRSKSVLRNTSVEESR